MSRIATWRAELLLDIQTDLGECPIWDHRVQALYFVDINAGEFYRFGDDGSATVRGVGCGLGAIGLWGDEAFVAGTDRGFARLTVDGKLEHVADLGLPTGQRLNDCRVGSDGAFWGGTMPWVVGDGTPPGAVYRLSPDLQVMRVLDDVVISNGLGWSPDGGTMYYVDSATRTIEVLDVDPDSGQVAGRRPVVELEHGIPDGLCVDADGTIWVAAWGASQVQRYTPEGRLIGVVEVPASMPTSCCFGGADDERLFVTSGSSGLRPGSRHLEHAGAVFAIDVGVVGLPARIFEGVS